MSFGNSFGLSTLERQIKGNLFLIKSLNNNQFIKFDKHFQKIKFDQLEDIQNMNDYTWIISSFDQDYTQLFQLRFGELIEITYTKKNYSLSPERIPFLIEFYNNNINQQTFVEMEDNLVQNYPCLLKNIFTNMYMCIKDGKVCFQENINIENCFQLILQPREQQPREQTYLRVLKHPKFANSQRIIIRNYRTGHSLFTKKEFGISLNHNQMLFTRPFLQKKQIDKWFLQFDVTKQSLQYQLIHIDTGTFAQNLTTQTSDKDNKLYIDLSVVQPQQFWNVLSLQNQPPTYGIPFLIQNSTNNYFLSQNVKSTNQQVYQVILQPDVTNDSLWIVFEHY